jgi:glucose-6-phosphate isomerase
VDNPDPYEWKRTLAGLKPHSTLVVVIAKSGTTFETMAQLLLACEWLGKERWKSHLVAVTDPVKGDLRTFAQHEGIPTLAIAPSIGGRFSIFSPVGIFAAAIAGLDAQAFLTGAKQVRDHMEKAPVEKNPLFILGYDLLRHAEKRNIHVCMPYSTRLRLIGDWFVQLWGESLGKDGKGFTPIAAVGATDQHSILQLLRDGPDDKVTFFLTLDRVADEVKIPRLQTLPGQQTHLPSFRLLEGHSLQELLTVEYRATSLVLTKQGRPNVTFQLDQLDERSLGALYFGLCVLTAFTGTLWGVNPFDQPGVEEGKVYIRESLTRSGAQTQDEVDENSPVARLRRDRE